MVQAVMTTGAVRRAKLQSSCHHQQTSNLLLCPAPNRRGH